MKYFFDCEFIEGFHKPLFGKKRHFIDLISIGIVCDDGRTYYAISKEYDFKKADAWVANNVILPIWMDLPSFKQMHTRVDSFHKYVGKTNKEIAHDIVQFIHAPILKQYDDGMSFSDDLLKQLYDVQRHPAHEFYGYYSDYDWVLFCSLFGRMIDLPKGFPMYCIDLKQAIDDKAKIYMDLPENFGAPVSLNETLTYYKAKPNYPIQRNEHNALADAKWNFELYKFLKTI